MVDTCCNKTLSISPSHYQRTSSRALHVDSNHFIKSCKCTMWEQRIGMLNRWLNRFHCHVGHCKCAARHPRFRAIIQQPRLFSSVSLSLSFNTTLLIHMASVELDAKRFHRRARFLISQWKVSFCSCYPSLGFLLESCLSPLLFGRRSRKDPLESGTAFHTTTHNALFPCVQ